MQSSFSQDAMNLYYSVIEQVVEKLQKDLQEMGNTPEQSAHILRQLEQQWKANLQEADCIDAGTLMGIGVDRTQNPANTYTKPSYMYPQNFDGDSQPNTKRRKISDNNSNQSFGSSIGSAANPHIQGKGLPHLDQLYNPFSNPSPLPDSRLSPTSNMTEGTVYGSETPQPFPYNYEMGNSNVATPPAIATPLNTESHNREFIQKNKKDEQEDEDEEEDDDEEEEEYIQQQTQTKGGGNNPGYNIPQYDGPMQPILLGFESDDESEGTNEKKKEKSIETEIESKISEKPIEETEIESKITEKEKDNNELNTTKEKEKTKKRSTISTPAKKEEKEGEEQQQQQQQQTEKEPLMYNGRDLNAPLNSDDDESEESDVEYENVIVCQYTKVQRQKNHWLVELKNGIMHINNRDYAFLQAKEGHLNWGWGQEREEDQEQQEQSEI